MGGTVYSQATLELLTPHFPQRRGIRGYVDVALVECAVSVQLCLQNATTWKNHLPLLSKVCKLTSALAAKAYGAVGQAASALHALVILHGQGTKKNCTRLVLTQQ